MNNPISLLKVLGIYGLTFDLQVGKEKLANTAE